MCPKWQQKRNDDLTPGVNISIQMGRTVLTLCAQQDPNQAASVVALGPLMSREQSRNPMSSTPERKRRSLKRYRPGVSGFHPQKPTGTHLILKEYVFFSLGQLVVSSFFILEDPCAEKRRWVRCLRFIFW